MSSGGSLVFMVPKVTTRKHNFWNSSGRLEEDALALGFYVGISTSFTRRKTKTMPS
jgi:hypothetical protein